MSKHWYTTKEILQVYTLKEEGKSFPQIGKETGINPASARTTIRILENYLSGEKELPINIPKSYKKAIKILQNKPQPNGQMQPVIKEQSYDNLARLEQAFTVFREAIADVITDEVNRRSGQAVLQKEKEIDALKEKYEKELQRLQAIIVEAKNSSITGLIKRKWGGL